jgi:hypothetical protein
VTPWKPSTCEKEMRVIQSVRTGFWDADLEQHVATCRVCSEAALAARVMNEMRAADEAQARIPDSGVMWRKAQLLAKREAGERATQPISMVERFAYALAIVGVMGACMWQWGAIRDWLAALGSNEMSRVSASASNLVAHSSRLLDPSNLGSISLGNSGPVIAGGAGVLLLFVLFAAYWSQSEE